jgi:hypothetical protein
VHPSSWQRAALGEGAIAVAGILVLADLASLWVLPALPLTVALVVKGHDLLAGLLVPVEHSDDELELSAVANGWALVETDGFDAVPGLEPSVLSARQPIDPLVGRAAFTEVVEDGPSVRVIAASARRAAGRPGAAAARAQARANRPRRKADG